MKPPAPRKTLLHALAHARAGDKGNHSNIAVFAYHPELYAVLVEQVTVARIEHHYAARRPSKVTRHVLPKLHGINIVLEDVLDGGVNESLNLDMHGKALSYHLLAMTVEVPETHVQWLQGPGDWAPRG